MHKAHGRARTQNRSIKNITKGTAGERGNTYREKVDGDEQARCAGNNEGCGRRNIGRVCRFDWTR